MNLNSGIHIENISRQSGIVAEFYFPKSFNKSSDFLFGFSGNYTTQFSIKNGLIFDNNNNNIFSLNYDKDTKLKVNIASGLSVISINDIFASKSNFSGYIDNIFFSGNTDNYLGLKISGEIPQLSFSSLNDFSGNNNILTGEITNNTPSRLFKIINAYVDSSSNLVSVSDFTTGDISGSGYIYLKSETGISYPTGLINLSIETNFKNINYSINSNPTNNIIFDEYLQLYPGENIILSTIQNKTFDVVSYFNTGSTREIDVKFEYESGCTFAPVDMTYSFTGSGYINATITGSGNLTGLVTGYYTGSGVSVISEYSEPYIFTGNYTGTYSTTASGLHNGSGVTGLIYSGYNVNLNSGNSGVVSLGNGTGLITGDIVVFSGKNPSGSFTMFGPGATGSYYLTGYTGYFTNTYSGNRVYIADSGLYFTLKVSGLIPFEVNNCIFDIACWEYCTTGISGNYTTGFNGNGTSYQEIVCSGDAYSGVSGSIYVFTGKIADSGSSRYINNFIGEQTSGYFKTYIGVYNGYSVPSIPWTITDFSINNFPVEKKESINSTGTGFYESFEVTGNVSKFKNNAILYTGVTEYPGQATFSNVWNLKTGFTNLIYTNFKYNNLYTSSIYYNSGSNLISPVGNRNSFFLEVDFNGTKLSGNSVSKLTINDGLLSGVYYITGQGETI